MPRVTDLQGTAGIGIRGPWKPHIHITLIFNPKTYALLGGFTTVNNSRSSDWILAKTAIVNKRGQLP
ncbi:MAG TPA: hypothetical protein VMV92_32485 [Streptosporangiaceae bacterium]|nr:hypothetical protein [Streptosporangiaceae bacterium]